jgi:hydrogenase maturation protease
MHGILVIGYGNTMRGDDGLGVVAAERVAELLPDVMVLTSHQLVPEMVEQISRSALVVFVDASAELPPGAIAVRTLDPDDRTSSTITHFLEPATLLLMARELFGVVPVAYWVMMGSAEFELGEHLSPAVNAAMPELVNQIAGIVVR